MSPSTIPAPAPGTSWASTTIIIAMQRSTELIGRRVHLVHKDPGSDAVTGTIESCNVYGVDLLREDGTRWVSVWEHVAEVWLQTPDAREGDLTGPPIPGTDEHAAWVHDLAGLGEPFSLVYRGSDDFTIRIGGAREVPPDGDVMRSLNVVSRDVLRGYCTRALAALDAADALDRDQGAP